MKKLKLNQGGFIPMMLTILAVIALIIIFVFKRVISLHQ
jgi:hypothetical protein